MVGFFRWWRMRKRVLFRWGRGECDGGGTGLQEHGFITLFCGRFGYNSALCRDNDRRQSRKAGRPPPPLCPEFWTIAKTGKSVNSCAKKSFPSLKSASSPRIFPSTPIRRCARNWTKPALSDSSSAIRNSSAMWIPPPPPPSNTSSERTANWGAAKTTPLRQKYAARECQKWVERDDVHIHNHAE